MNNIIIERTNGNILKSLPNEDNISGFITWMPELPAGFTTENPIQPVSSIESAEKLGITNDAEHWDIKVLHYQLKEVFRLNPAVTLYVGLYKRSDGTSNYHTYSEVKQIQNYTGGKLRQLAVYTPNTPIKEREVKELQSMATVLQYEDCPVSIIYAGKGFCIVIKSVYLLCGIPVGDLNLFQQRMPT